MNDITRVLKQIEEGDPSLSSELLPLVYAELQQLARARLSREAPGQTLQATDLVHEAYLRLVQDVESTWDSRGHFFAAAAEAMRRILIERARRRKADKHGGGLNRIAFADDAFAAEISPDRMLALDEALDRLAQDDELAAEIVKLRAFAGLNMDEAAKAVGVAPATAYRHWSYGRAWIIAEISGFGT